MNFFPKPKYRGTNFEDKKVIFEKKMLEHEDFHKEKKVKGCWLCEQGVEFAT